MVEVCGVAAAAGLAAVDETVGLAAGEPPDVGRGRGRGAGLALTGAGGAKVKAGLGAALASKDAASLGTATSVTNVGSIVGTSSGRIEGRLTDGA